MDISASLRSGLGSPPGRVCFADRADPPRGGEVRTAKVTNMFATNTFVTGTYAGGLDG